MADDVGDGFTVELVYSGDPLEEREWIFTFGSGHVHPVTGAPLDDCFVRIPGTFHTARRQMLDGFGIKWCGQYASEDDAFVRAECVSLARQLARIEGKT